MKTGRSPDALRLYILWQRRLDLVIACSPFRGPACNLSKREGHIIAGARISGYLPIKIEPFPLLALFPSRGQCRSGSGSMSIVPLV